MAEDDRTWDLLTGSLAACDLARPDCAWAFLVLQGLVNDSAANRAEFARVVAEEQAVGVIIGPTMPRRIALRLKAAGIALPQASTPDPQGVLAAARWAVIRDWTHNSSIERE
jgi:hypothetical protein